MKRVCDAQETVFQTWETNLQKLDIGQQDLSMATNAGNWQAYRDKWAELLPVLKELEAAAVANRNAPGAANILSLYRNDLGLFLQKAGLASAGSLDDFSARVLAGLDGERPAAAATAGVNVVQQSVTRGIEFGKGVGTAEADKVLAEYRGQVEQRTAERMEQLGGSTMGGYFGGFGTRIKAAFGGWLFYLVTVCFIGAWMAHKRRQNPVTVGTAVGLAFLGSIGRHVASARVRAVHSGLVHPRRDGRRNGGNVSERGPGVRLAGWRGWLRISDRETAAHPRRNNRKPARPGAAVRADCGRRCCGRCGR